MGEDQARMSETEAEYKFKFLRSGGAEPAELDWGRGIETVRQAMSEAMSAKNIAFLLGAGCSSFMKDGQDLGIPTMAQLAKEFCAETLAGCGKVLEFSALVCVRGGFPRPMAPFLGFFPVQPGKNYIRVQTPGAVHPWASNFGMRTRL